MSRISVMVALTSWARVVARGVGSFQLRYIFRINLIGNVSRLFSEIGVGEPEREKRIKGHAKILV